MFKRKKKKEKTTLELAFKHIENSLKLLILSSICGTLVIFVTVEFIYTIFTESLLENDPYIIILRLFILFGVIILLAIQIIRTYRYLKYTYEMSMTDLAIMINEQKRRLKFVDKFGTIIPKDDSKKTVH